MDWRYVSVSTANALCPEFKKQNKKIKNMLRAWIMLFGLIPYSLGDSVSSFCGNNDSTCLTACLKIKQESGPQSLSTPGSQPLHQYPKQEPVCKACREVTPCTQVQIYE
jgi:hypothetical protein